MIYLAAAIAITALVFGVMALADVAALLGTCSPDVYDGCEDEYHPADHRTTEP